MKITTSSILGILVAVFLSMPAMSVDIIVANSNNYFTVPAMAPVFNFDIFLVKGVVDEVAFGSNGYFVVGIRIESICNGSKDLIGKRFEQLADDGMRPGSRNSHVIEPVPKKNDKGIWAIRITNGVITPWSSYGRCHFPSIDGYDQRYLYVVKLAKAVESVEAATISDEKTKLISEYAYSGIPEISRWATELVLRGNKGSNSCVFTAAGVSSRLPVFGKLVVDEILSDGNRGKSWQYSKERCVLFSSLIGAKLDCFESEGLANRLQSARYALASDIVVSLIAQIVDDKLVEARTKQLALSALPLSGGGGDAEVLDFLVDQLSNGSTQIVNEVAAELRLRGHLNDNHKTRLREMKGKLTTGNRLKQIESILDGKTVEEMKSNASITIPISVPKNISMTIETP